MLSKQNTKKFWLAVSAAVAAGVVYCSWPLGYYLNPVVSRRGLASELEALHQPYNWLFILLDVLSGVLVMAVAILLWRAHKDRLRRIILVNFALFGLLTILDALMPMSCEPSLRACPSLSHQPLLILHGVVSIAASVCLFISAVLVWWTRRRSSGSLVMSSLMAGWTLFGLVSLYFFFRPGPGYLAQHYYITLCSIWVMLLPSMLRSKYAASYRLQASLSPASGPRKG